MKKITLLVAILFCIIASNAQVVSTFAGSNQGYVDGIGIAAQFFNPSGVCTDASGNVYVADYENNRIRKITPAGVVTTFAGSGTSGSADGTGVAAQISSPSGICIDVSGNLYVASKIAMKIRKITPAGVVTTLAGSGRQGSADGIGIAAQFNFPSGICTDASGNVYVADTWNNRIRKITPSGVVTTFAGGTIGYANGTGTAAKFNNPSGVCVDVSGNVYVADTYNNKIRMITPEQLVITVAGSYQGSGDGIGTAAQFNKPQGICMGVDGDVYVADTENNRLRKIKTSGIVTTLVGSIRGSADGTGTAAQFYNPTGVYTDVFGKIYVADH